MRRGTEDNYWDIRIQGDGSHHSQLVAKTFLIKISYDLKNSNLLVCGAVSGWLNVCGEDTEKGGDARPCIYSCFQASGLEIQHLCCACLSGTEVSASRRDSFSPGKTEFSYVLDKYLWSSPRKSQCV